MKKVALIVEGVVAQKFMELVVSKFFSNNFYLVITKAPECLPPSLPSTFEVHIFDPTSSYRLSPLIDAHVSDAFVLLENVKEQQAVCEIIRQKNKEVRLVSLGQKWEGMKDEQLILLDPTQIIANKCIAKIPNVPSVPQGFGLEQGEVMEIGVPFGSVFAYRHIGSLRQKDYRIVGVYRKNSFHLSHPSMVIQPRDQLLVVGNPETLNNVYLQVKSNVGQFPVPFGRDFYLYVDMCLQSKEALQRDIDQALALHSQLKSAMLYIHVLNPTNHTAIEQIRTKEAKNIQVVVDFRGLNFATKLRQDSRKKIGLVIIGKEIFKRQVNRKALFESVSPIFKTNAKGLKGIKKSMVVLNNSMERNEDISSVMFDVCAQMDLKMLLYDFDPDKRHKMAVIENYSYLSHIYNRKIQVIRTQSKNPILFLNSLESPILQFLPFESCIIKNPFWGLFSTSPERMAFLNDMHPQMLIPVVE
ncbi:Potassium transporter TrkA [Helicobacter sp. NHP19-012]|uniref:Potassium transporter TrkA n=1 Tax=Helicobacter gastrofelis TaxID=2849642 RepID=A0ABN6IA58_9HELI|nr:MULTISPECIES: TrkA C-terminal domain-containing protein [unclassified Helicobacter]BCZ19617.1 Potassium transporter TrkA [Helicobacter sp. NHP19-012]GMB96500.1 Potassium transporter TrkA [Helicobacter sp. NHP22-001]